MIFSNKTVICVRRVQRVFCVEEKKMCSHVLFLYFLSICWLTSEVLGNRRWTWKTFIRVYLGVSLARMTFWQILITACVYMNHMQLYIIHTNCYKARAAITFCHSFNEIKFLQKKKKRWHKWLIVKMNY